MTKSLRNVSFGLLLAAVWGVAALMFISNQTRVDAQSLPNSSQAQQAGSMTLEGMISVHHLDPAPGSGLEYRTIVTLTDDSLTMYQMNMSLADGMRYQNQRVRIAGRPGVDNTVQVDMVIPQEYATSDFLDPNEGTFNYINVLCSFSDSGGANQNAPSYFDALFSDTYPGISNHWQTISYGKVSLSGTQTVTQWYPMGVPSTNYDGNNQDDLATVCLNAADADVDFSLYNGINLMFDVAYVGFAQGTPGYSDTRDGVSRSWKLTWNPPFSYQAQSFISHEIGHTLNLPHSGGDDTTGRFPYDSYWDTMSGGGDNAKLVDPTVGNLSPGTNAYYMDRLGWIPSAQRASVADKSGATFTLERLLNPQSASNPLMIYVPINDSTTKFYVVEAHQAVSYDEAAPAEGVLIYYVDLDRWNSGVDAPARVVDPDANNDVNDAGAVWVAGETYSDATNNIQIEVKSASGSSYVVEVRNDGTGGGGTATPTPTTTPTDPITRVAPANGANITVGTNYVSKFQWEPVNGTEWYHVFVSNNDFTQVFFDKWYQAGDVCTASVCTTTDSIWLVGTGEFSWWMTQWSSAIGDNYTNLYEKSTFSVNLPLPGTIDGTATPTESGVALNWGADANALWYQVWVGPADYSSTAYLNWHDAAVVCGVEFCTLNLNGSLPAGDYEFWIQPWNPTGVTDWQKAAEYTVGS